MQTLKWQEQARHLAAAFLRQDVELAAELPKLPPEAQGVVNKQIREILLRNILLPREGAVEETVQRALHGLPQLARDKKAAQRVVQEIERIFQSFLQVRQNALDQFKAQFSAQLDGVKRALEQQIHRQVKIDVEHTPQFQEQWRNFEAQLVQQFEPLLEKHKNLLTTL
jgi:membrane-associated HD superfamily phosphohydrolase